MLEVGGGLGVLCEHLAQRVAHVHVVEVDERLREALLDATSATRMRVGCTGAMPWRWTSPRCRPSPRKLVSNLPYGIGPGRSCCARSRICRHEPVGGDGPARGRRAASRRRRGRPPTGCPRCWRRCLRGERAACHLAQRVYPSRTWTRCWWVPVRHERTDVRPRRATRELAAPGFRAIAARRWQARWRWRRARRAGRVSRSARPCFELGHTLDVRAERLAPRGVQGAGARCSGYERSVTRKTRRMGCVTAGRVAAGSITRSARAARRSTWACSSDRCERPTAGTSWQA